MESILGNDQEIGKSVLFKKDQIIFAEGDASLYMYIVKTGKVRVVKGIDESFIPISVLGPQEFIGELSLFDDKTRTTTAIAEEDSELIAFRKSHLKKVVRQCPEWVENIMRTLCDRLRSSITMLRDHKIVDDQDPANELLPEKEAQIKRALNQYLQEKD